MMNSYPKIYNVGHAALKLMNELDVIVDVEEKVDGSQLSAMVKLEMGGGLEMRSKGAEILPDYPEAMFVKAVEGVRAISMRMHFGLHYVFEFLKGEHHNTLKYDRVPTYNLILLDVIGEGGYFTYDQKFVEAGILGVDVVPLLYSGPYCNITEEDMERFLKNESVLGGCPIEGVVIKPAPRNVFGRDGKELMAKYVSPKFKEEHGKAWRSANPGGKDVIENLISIYKVEARWEKAMQHLRDSGVLVGENSDIGALVREVQRDLVGECADAIAAHLYTWAITKVQRGVVRGLPEWYKKKLAFPDAEE